MVGGSPIQQMSKDVAVTLNEIKLLLQYILALGILWFIIWLVVTLETH